MNRGIICFNLFYLFIAFKYKLNKYNINYNEYKKK